ncbi:MAG TPA: exosortase-associated EpsI family protein [Candidatus Paceibacterota bacterium]|nr:exosortase-associated EpsI family protein [Verrucomicrobiota bacterium]HRY50826.1 exosortase-associated EpsI family protein [Candidatus Paceibacterota bacterium]HSA01126.1 exosortase-associated EpsI family protein [Candidatus Paceibacterota bacterium]
MSNGISKTGLARKLLLGALVLAVVIGLVWEYYPLEDAEPRLRHLPDAGLGFRSKDIPLSDTEKSIFGKAQALKRFYDFGAYQFFFTVIDGTRNRHAIHDPLYCFRGAGWKVIQQADRPLEVGTGRMVRLEKEGKQEEVLFWFSDGHQRHGSAMRFWWQTTLRRLTLGLSGPEPVLVIVQPYRADQVNWQRLVDTVVQVLEF